MATLTLDILEAELKNERVIHLLSFESPEAPDYPATTDVRRGVSYAMGVMEGTLKHQIYAPLEITESVTEVIEL